MSQHPTVSSSPVLKERPAKSASERVWRGGMYGIMLIVMFIYVYPLLYLLNISVKSPTEFLSAPAKPVTSFDFSNYVNAWVQGNFSQYFFNSLLYVVVPTALSLIITLLVAFPVARGYVKGANLWYTFFVMSLFLPNGLIPQFLLVLKIHLYNTQIGYMLLKTGGVGLGLLILVGFIKSIPRELDESAAIDGCGYFRFIFVIVTPLVKPALATTAIFGIIGIWNDIIGPTVYLADNSKWPLVLGLYQFYGQYSNEWTVLAAGIVMVALPLVILYAFMQKYFVAGAVAGSVKS